MNRAKTEVLRYLGHRGQAVPSGLDALLDECMAALGRDVRPRRVWKVFNLKEQMGVLTLADAGLTLDSADIRRHLSGCGQAALLAATLGTAADSLIRSWQPIDLTRALILDACATQLVEEVCDELEEEIRAKAVAGGMSATSRFSPGYGDLSLELQPGLLALLDAGRRIGLTCSPDYLLMPRKSVTAIIGIGSSLQAGAAGCAACGMRGRCGYYTKYGGSANDCP